MSSDTARQAVKEDRWIYSQCKMCIDGCGIRVHVVDGVVVKIEGDPSNPDNLGKLCPKGNAGIMRLYDPNRVKAPMKRTNPNKGDGVDPGWQEISWEEAFDLVATRLKKIREEDPRKLLFAKGDFHRQYLWCWPTAFGSPHFFTTVGTYCGAAYHPINGMVDGSFAGVNDYEYCNYWIQIGAGDGFSSHLHLSGAIKRMADARARGMKLVVVEPRLSVGAAKADEWIPIRPATDRAFALGMMHVLVHELGIYDAQFLKHRTNAPYLIGADGYYVRDKRTKKPLVIDAANGKALTFDSKYSDCALEGTYVVNGISCRPAFQVFKDILAEHTPERMSEITTVPASTIRRIAKEYGEAARVGSTIMIQGKEYPYRPAAVNYYRGAQSHYDGTMDNLTLKLLNMLVGNIDIPGGHIGVPYDHELEGLHISPGEDGLLRPEPHLLHPPVPFKYPPNSAHLIELFPIGFDAGQLCAETLLNPQQFGLDFQPEALMIFHTNPLWNMPGYDQLIEIFKKLDFIVAIDVVLNESTVWADVVLPEYTYLEGTNLHCTSPPFASGHTVRQPVIPPMYDTKDASDILIELADRIGFLDRFNDMMSYSLGLTKKPQYMLDPNRKYTGVEIMDTLAKAFYGDDHGLEWFKEHGHGMKARSVERYLPHGDLRMPFYFEFIKKTGDELRSKLAPHGVDWDITAYTPLPYWRESPLWNEPAEYDLFAFAFKEATNNFAESTTIPWLYEINERDAAQMGVLINTATARDRGLADGDVVTIKSPYGEVRGMLKLTQGIHPQCLAISNALTKWIDHPTIRRKGTHFNRLLPASLKYTDKATGAFETIAKVRITKVS